MAVAAPDRSGITRASRVPTVLVIFIAAGAIGMQFARLAGAGSLVTPFILLASTSFVALGIASGALRTAMGRVSICGLVCCWIGDMVGPRNFLLGLGAFLVGHLFFAASFTVHGIEPRRAGIASGIVSVVTIATGALLWPYVPLAERFHLVAYCIVISIMLIAAAGARPGLPLAIPAAVLFYISDVCVARWRYADSALDGYLCYVLYYAACALFALNTRPALRSPRAG